MFRALFALSWSITKILRRLKPTSILIADRHNLCTLILNFLLFLSIPSCPSPKYSPTKTPYEFLV